MLISLTLVPRLLRRLLTFVGQRRASAAVEFAIILPVAILLYAAAGQVSDGVTASRKVTVVTRTLVDLLSLQSTSSQSASTPTPPNALSAETLSSLMTSAQALIYPEPVESLTMTLTAIDLRNTLSGVCCNATVRWSYTKGGTLRACSPLQTGLLGMIIGTVSTALPSDLVPTGTVLPQPISYIVADVGYTYQPIVRMPYLNFVPSMQRTQYMMPRAVGQVVTGPLPASGTQYGKVCY